jgi:hypothetical protein
MQVLLAPRNILKTAGFLALVLILVFAIEAFAMRPQPPKKLDYVPADGPWRSPSYEVTK